MSKVYRSFSEPLKFLNINVEIWQFVVVYNLFFIFFIPPYTGISSVYCLLILFVSSIALLIYTYFKCRKDPFFVRVLLTIFLSEFLMKFARKKVVYVS